MSLIGGLLFYERQRRTISFFCRDRFPTNDWKTSQKIYNMGTQSVSLLLSDATQLSAIHVPVLLPLAQSLNYVRVICAHRLFVNCDGLFRKLHCPRGQACGRQTLLAASFTAMVVVLQHC